MSTPINPLASQVTGLEGDFEQYVQSMVAAEIQKASSTNSGQPQQPLELEINGQRYKFQTTAELQAALSATFQTVGSQYASVQEQLAALQAEKEKLTKPNVASNQPEFDKKHYGELFVNDPLEAQKYMNQFLGTPEHVQRGLAEAERVSRVMAAYQFKEEHPEFPDQDPRAAAAIEAVMKQRGLPWTSEGLEMAYLVAREKGAIQVQPRQPQQPQQQQPFAQQPYQPQFPQGQQDPRFFNGGQQFTQQQMGYAQAPPMVNRNATPVPDSAIAQMENLSLEQIESIFSQTGQGTFNR